MQRRNSITYPYSSDPL